MSASLKFKDLLLDPQVKQRWEGVRKYFFLRESTYDVSNRCNMSCEGCYYYVDNNVKQLKPKQIDQWQTMFDDEVKRGITYIVLAGAEPALEPEIIACGYNAIKHGAIASNGLVPIDSDIRYSIHISVWGDDQRSKHLRGTTDTLRKQIEIYQGDDRAVFVYTFTRDNIQDVLWVAKLLHQHGLPLTFNLFSAPHGYQGDLSHNHESLEQTKKMMQHLMQEYPDTILYSPYNIAVHTHHTSLHDLFHCPYPRCNENKFIGLGKTFRRYAFDLSWERDTACCVPNTQCHDCRHYAAGSAIVTARLQHHVTSHELFCSWLDYVDTYLAVWVLEYQKNQNLMQHIVAPPQERERQ